MVHCINCGADVEPGFSTCSECGYPLAGEAYEEGEEEVVPNSSRMAPWRGRSPLFWVVIAVIVVACMVVSAGAVIGYGWYQGLQQASESNQKLAEEYYSQGLIYMGERNYSLAANEFEMALQYNPDHPYAGDRLAEAKALARAAGQLPKPTTPGEQVDSAVSTLLAQGEEAYGQGDWEEAVEKLEELRSLDADYETEKLEALLFSAYYNAGLQLVNDDRLEEALRRFDAALEIDPESADALGQKRLGTLYLSGMGYWEVDWGRAIASFSELYEAKPDYKDTEQRLHDAYVNQGDLLLDREDPCAAKDAYQSASNVFPDAAIASKIERADDLCKVGPPSPTAVVKDTPIPEEEAEEPTVTPTAPSGKPSGQIAFPVFDPDISIFEVQIAGVDGSNRRTVVTEAHHPSFSPDGTRLAVRSVQQNYLGLRVLNVDGSDFVGVTDHAEDGSPIWSPDGTRLAFSSNRHGDRRWRVYTMEAYGDDEDNSIAEGSSPSWSQDGFQIAYKSCDPTGALCGIFVMDSGGINKQRLTTDADDTAPAWSPDGNRIAFMSDRDGNWEIYVMNAADGADLLRLTDSSSDDGLPTWSPDGNFIAYVSNRGGSWSIWAIQPDGTGDQKLFDLGGTLGGDWTSDRISWAR